MQLLIIWQQPEGKEKGKKKGDEKMLLLKSFENKQTVFAESFPICSSPSQ